MSEYVEPPPTKKQRQQQQQLQQKGEDPNLASAVTEAIRQLVQPPTDGSSASSGDAMPSLQVVQAAGSKNKVAIPKQVLQAAADALTRAHTAARHAQRCSSARPTD